MDSRTNKYDKKKAQTLTGFTLVEVMVTLALFMFVVLVSLSSLIAMVHANQKAQAFKSVINNLNFALESMERNIRVGRTYHCNSTPVPIPTTLAIPRDCVDGTFLALESSKGKTANVDDQVVYRLEDARIEISKDGGTSWLSLTSAGVTVEKLNFTVEGTGSADGVQPFVIINLEVSTGASVKTFTTLSIQTSASQRRPDK